MIRVRLCQRVVMAVVLLLICCGLALSQASRVPEVVNIQTNSPAETVIPRDKVGAPTFRKNDLPVTQIVRVRASAADLKRKCVQLQKANAELQSTRGQTPNDLRNILARAEEIFELAFGLHDEMGLPPIEAIKMPQGTSAPNANTLPTYMTLLDASINSFIADPIVSDPHSLDASLISEVDAKLRSLIANSSSVAEAAKTAAGIKSSKRLKLVARPNDEQRVGSAALLQLDLDCDVWRTEMFTTAAAKVKLWRKLTINGVKLQVNYHKLMQEQVTPLNECAPRRVVGFLSPETYAVGVKEFLSYEVNGKVLAYQPTYSVLRTKKGKTSRIDQPLYLYFIDESGRGAFELYTGNKPLSDLPDWTKEASASPK